MVLFTGDTVEEAIEKGLSTLSVSRIKAHITVISREKKGFLGFGKKPAQVEIRPIAQNDEIDDTPKKVEEQTIEPSTRPSAYLKGPQIVPVTVEKSEKQVSSESEVMIKASENVTEPSNVISLSDRRQQQKVATSETTATETISVVDNSTEQLESLNSTVIRRVVSKDMDKATQEVSDYIKKIIYEMDVEATIETKHNRRNIFLQIETSEAGRVIGYHGKVLKSLQLLAQNYLHDHYSKNFTVTLNVHDYMEHRTETLIEFANKMADRVLETGRDVAMDPMSNQERKTIHKAVSRIEGVTSYSEGSDPERYVVITLSD